MAAELETACRKATTAHLLTSCAWLRVVCAPRAGVDQGRRSRPAVVVGLSCADHSYTGSLCALALLIVRSTVSLSHPSPNCSTPLSRQPPSFFLRSFHRRCRCAVAIADHEHTGCTRCHAIHFISLRLRDAAGERTGHDAAGQRAAISNLAHLVAVRGSGHAVTLCRHTAQRSSQCARQ